MGKSKKYSNYCNLGTRIQTILFDVNKYTVGQAKKWLKDNDFKYGDVDSPDQYHRFRQEEPSEFKDDSFRTTDFDGNMPTGIKVVIGCPKHEKMAEGGNIKKQYRLVPYKHMLGVENMLESVGQMQEQIDGTYEEAVSKAKEFLAASSHAWATMVEISTIGKNVLAGKNVAKVTRDEVIKLEKGGDIPNNYTGRTAKNIWDSWTPEQRTHFIKDHNTAGVFLYPDLNWDEAKEMSKNQNDDTFEQLKSALEKHKEMGQYETGGLITDDYNEKLEKEAKSLQNELISRAIFPASGESTSSSAFIVMANGKFYIYPKNMKALDEFLMEQGYTVDARGAELIVVFPKTKPDVASIVHSYKFELIDWSARVHEDDYEQGEGEQVNTLGAEVNVTFDSADDLIKYIYSKILFKEISREDFTAFEEGRITTSLMVDNENYPASEAEIEKWKKGELKLYAANYDFYVALVDRKTPSVEELVNLFGIPDYDGQFKKMAEGGAVEKNKVLFDEAPLRIQSANGVVNFDFDSKGNTGWQFDTDDVAEASAIILKSKFKDNKVIKSLPITAKQKKEASVEQVIFWLSGGNEEWKFGEKYNESFEKIYEKVFKSGFAANLKKEIAKAKTIGGLMAMYQKEFPASVFEGAAFDEGYAGDGEMGNQNPHETDSKEWHEYELAKKIKRNPAHAGNKYHMSVKEAEKILGEKIVSEYPSFGTEFKELSDNGNTQIYVRDCGEAIIGSKKIPLVATAEILDLEGAIPEEELKGIRYSVHIKLYANPAFIDNVHFDSVRDSAGLDAEEYPNDQIFGDFIEQMVGVPVEGKEFKKKMEAQEFILSKEMQDKLDGVGTMTGFYLDKPINRIGTTGWTVIKNMVDHKVKLFEKGGNVLDKIKGMFSKKKHSMTGTMVVAYIQLDKSVLQAWFDFNSLEEAQTFFDRLKEQKLISSDEVFKNYELIDKNNKAYKEGKPIYSEAKKKVLSASLFHDYKAVSEWGKEEKFEKGGAIHGEDKKEKAKLLAKLKDFNKLNTLVEKFIDSDFEACFDISNTDSIELADIKGTKSAIDKLANLFYQKLRDADESSVGEISILLTRLGDLLNKTVSSGFIFKKDKSSIYDKITDEIGNKDHIIRELKTKKFEKGGQINEQTDIVIASLDKLVEYSKAIPPLVKGISHLPSWVMSKMAKVEFSVANVKHTLQSKYPTYFEKGGMVMNDTDGDYISMQCRHIGIYSKELLAAEESIKFEAWMEYLINLSGDYIDDVYHTLDYMINGKKYECGGSIEVYADGGTIEPVEHGDKKYRVYNGTFYHAETPDAVVYALDSAYRTGRRIKIYYGDVKTGRDWHEENDTIGTVGRSNGEVKIPLLIATSRSKGGTGILDNCIVKIKDMGTGSGLYRLDNYQAPKVEIVPSDMPAEYSHNVNIDGEVYSRHKTEKSAKMLAAKIMGKGGAVLDDTVEDWSLLEQQVEIINEKDEYLKFGQKGKVEAIIVPTKKQKAEGHRLINYMVKFSDGELLDYLRSQIALVVGKDKDSDKGHVSNLQEAKDWVTARVSYDYADTKKGKTNFLRTNRESIGHPTVVATWIDDSKAKSKTGLNIFIEAGFMNENSGAKELAEKGNYEIELEAVPNPDYGRDRHNGSVRIKKHRVKVKSLNEARSKFLAFVEDNDLGSGNLPATYLYEGNKKVGMFAYNGRLWTVGKDGMFGKDEIAIKFEVGGLIPSVKKGDLVFCPHEGSRGLVGLITSDFKTEDETSGWDVYFRGLRGTTLFINWNDMEDVAPNHMSFAENNGDLMHYPNIARDKGIILNPKYLEALDADEEYACGGSIYSVGSEMMDEINAGAELQEDDDRLQSPMGVRETVGDAMMDEMALGGTVDSLNKKWDFPEHGVASFKELIDKGVFDEKFKAVANVIEFNRTKFNRMEGNEQREYEAKMNKKKTTYNLKYAGRDGFTDVSKQVFDYATLPETAEKNHWHEYGKKYAEGGSFRSYETEVKSKVFNNDTLLYKFTTMKGFGLKDVLTRKVVPIQLSDNFNQDKNKVLNGANGDLVALRGGEWFELHFTQVPVSDWDLGWEAILAYVPYPNNIEQNIQYTEAGNQQASEDGQLYKVVKVYEGSARKKILKKGLSLTAARAMVTGYPDSKTSMVVYYKMADGGDVNDVPARYTKPEFEKWLKDAFKQPNKWHFFNAIVDGTPIKMKFFIGQKEVDVQIFMVNYLSNHLPKNYAGKRETLAMIQDVVDNKLGRINQMVQNWKKEGRAFSHLENNDKEFFDKIGVPYEKVGIASQTGNDIVYYNVDMYKDGDAAIKHGKLEQGGEVLVTDKDTHKNLAGQLDEEAGSRWEIANPFEQFCAGGSIKKSVLSKEYHKPFKLKGNGRRTYTIFQSHGDSDYRQAAKQLFADVSYAEHKKRVKEYEKLYNETAKEYMKKVDSEFKRVFKREKEVGDYRVSGIWRDEFSDKAKKEIRKDLDVMGELFGAICLHNSILKKADKVDIHKLGEGNTAELFAEGGAIRNNVSIASIRSAIKKAVDGNKDRTTVHSGDIRVDMVYSRPALTLHIYYKEEHIATYEIITSNESGVLTYYPPNDKKAIIQKIEEVLEELGYHVSKIINGKPTYFGYNLPKEEREEEPYRYISIQKVPHGLKLILNDEGREEIKETKSKGEDSIWGELFDDVQDNSEYKFISDGGEMGFGLTNAPMITDGYYYDDNGKFTDKGHKDSEVYAYMDYQLHSPLEKLLENGDVVFERIGGDKPKKFEDGGAISEREFLEKYFSASVFSENVANHFEVEKKKTRSEAEAKSIVADLKARGFAVKKKIFSDFISIMGVKKKADKTGHNSITKAKYNLIPHKEYGDTGDWDGRVQFEGSYEEAVAKTKEMIKDYTWCKEIQITIVGGKRVAKVHHDGEVIKFANGGGIDPTAHLREDEIVEGVKHKFVEGGFDWHSADEKYDFTETDHPHLPVYVRDGKGYVAIGHGWYSFNLADWRKHNARKMSKGGGIWGKLNVAGSALADAAKTAYQKTSEVVVEKSHDAKVAVENKIREEKKKVALGVLDKLRNKRDVTQKEAKILHAADNIIEDKFADGGKITPHYADIDLLGKGWDITKLTPRQKDLIVEPSFSPETYYQDGELNEKQAQAGWISKLKMAGLNESDIAKAKLFAIAKTGSVDGRWISKALKITKHEGAEHAGALRRKAKALGWIKGEAPLTLVILDKMRKTAKKENWRQLEAWEHKITLAETLIKMPHKKLVSTHGIA